MDKKKLFLICLFTGIFGGHYFAIGKYKKGFLYLFTIGGLFIGWLKDLILIATKDNFLACVNAQEEKLSQIATEKRLLQEQQIKEEKERIAQLDREGIAYCPRCKSTSVQYVERRKQLSLGRAALGTVLINPLAGAVGAVTSKKYKGKVKCLKCGYEFKAGRK